MTGVGVWSAHLRGHLLLFDPRGSAPLPARAGLRLLGTAALLEATRLAAVAWAYPAVPLWVVVPLVLALALLAVPRLSGVRRGDLGFPHWGEWSATEKSYFVQVLALVAILFPLVLGLPRVSAGGVPRLAGVIVTYLRLGFYQELVYRGMVQNALAERWGVVAGIVVANVLYTFGPFHWRYFGSEASRAVSMFASIFLIGLFFGALYRRSGNLWIVGTMHAIGNAYIVATAGASR
jgi:membrane protease YdiL (CAAX protease family)